MTKEQKVNVLKEVFADNTFINGLTDKNIDDLMVNFKRTVIADQIASTEREIIERQAILASLKGL